MRKLIPILLLLLIAIPCFAQQQEARVIQGVVGTQPAAATSDSCTGTLLYSHHAENNDAADTNANGTQGCSASVTYKSWTKTSAVYDNTATDFYDGAYSLKMAGYGHRATINNTGNWADLSATGSVSMWYKPDGTHNSYIFGAYIDSTHYISVYYTQSTGCIRITVNDGAGAINLNGTQVVAVGGSMIYAGWDAATDLLQVKVDAGAWETKTNSAWVDIGTVTSYYVGNARISDYGSSYGWIDTFKMYTTKDCT